MSLVIALILWGMVLLVVLTVWALVTVEVVEWARDFHRAGLERVRAGNRADKCLEMLVELHKMERGE